MPFMTDSVFKSMKEKAYFLKPTHWKPSDLSKVLEAQTSATRIQFGVMATVLIPQSADQTGILTALPRNFGTLGHFSQLSEPQFPSL